uniref:Uncharacterized protein n=1 Tax=Anguilla anguilla TaxID=7936 RepID=A0A0E9XK49_ANGAN
MNSMKVHEDRLPVHHRYALAWLFNNTFKVKILHSMPLMLLIIKLSGLHLYLNIHCVFKKSQYL